ncbi:MAG TPA: hypothetical protein VG368_07135 [Acidimicrobiales bacterium]|nr:hypothetical protein [Acidimicrobiales bacterium]
MHDARSEYVERCWLPLLGPSTLLFLRFAASALEQGSDGVEFDLPDVARALGLGGRTSEGAPFRRMLIRAVNFRVARIERPGCVAIRRYLPEISSRQLARLPVAAADAHAMLRAGSNPRTPAVEHADRLARSLAALGESPREIERQLRRWRFSPAIAGIAAANASCRERSSTSERPTAPVTTHPRPPLSVESVRSFDVVTAASGGHHN